MFFLYIDFIKYVLPYFYLNRHGTPNSYTKDLFGQHKKMHKRYTSLIVLVQWFLIFLVSFFGIFSFSLKLVRRTESVRQKNYWLVTKRVFFFTVFVTNLLIPSSHWLSATNLFQQNVNKCQKKKTKSKLKITVIRKQACCTGCRQRPFPIQLHQQAKSTPSVKWS